MRIYLAAPYSTKEQMNLYAEELRNLGFTITSRWLEEPHAPNTQIHDLADDINASYAAQDLEDVKTADLIIFFTDPTKTITRGGRHVEFGYALALGRAIWVVGEEENIFHHIPGIAHFEDWDRLKWVISKMNWRRS